MPALTASFMPWFSLLSSVSNSMTMASTMGTIMDVVAVFEIHMERNMEQAMNPSMISAGLVPTKLNIARAILVQNIGDESSSE